MLNAYRKPEAMEKKDFYLIQGIFEHDPEAKDINVLMEEKLENDEEDNAARKLKMHTAMGSKFASMINANKNILN